MTKYFAIILFLFLVALVVLYFSKESGHEQERVRVDKVWQSKLDSLETAYKDSLHSREIFYLKSFSEAVKKSDFYEGEAVAYKQKFLNEKARNRKFTDTSRDSLISSIR